jgi:DNA-binding response OmpR family regulator
MQLDAPHILVLEDDRSLANAIVRKLELEGFIVSSASSAQRAEEILAGADRIDAIWLDHYLLGDEDGLDFLANIRGKVNSPHANVPVYVVSNTASDDKVKSYLRLGAEKYYVKADHSLEEIITSIKQNIE